MINPSDHGLPHLIEVKVDEERHTRAPENEVERLSWAATDTAIRILAEYAARIVMADLRLQVAEQGGYVPSDGELFQAAIDSGDPDAPKDYYELAAIDRQSETGVDAVFRRLVELNYRLGVDAIMSKEEGE